MGADHIRYLTALVLTTDFGFTFIMFKAQSANHLCSWLSTEYQVNLARSSSRARLVSPDYQSPHFKCASNFLRTVYICFTSIINIAATIIMTYLSAKSGSDHICNKNAEI